MSEYALELRDIVKAFPGIVACDHVDLRVRRGSIHALVGENGAGKTTLMRVAYGETRPDAGDVTIETKALGRGGTARAIALGLGMVHQHFMLVPTLSVCENVALGSEPRRGPWFDRDAARIQVRDTAARFGFAVDPDARVGDLGVGEQQRVEILKVLVRGARILILDEPTAVLAPREVEDFFAILRRLVSMDHTILLISHRLQEVLSIAETITVMRDGRVVDEMRSQDADVGRLAHAIVGRSVPVVSRQTRRSEPRRPSASTANEGMHGLNGQGGDADAAPIVLQCEDLCTDGKRDALQHVSFTVRGGEILGVAGVEGNGQRDLAHALLGLLPLARGRVLLHGEDVTTETTAARRTRGMAYVPADRLQEALIAPMRIDENAILGRQREGDLGRGEWLSPARVGARALALLGRYEVRADQPGSPASILSGGNQQKLVVGREIDREPDFLLLAQPTRGVDVGGIAFLHTQILRARDDGKAILLISADLNEILALADRVLVLFAGRVAGECRAADATAAQIGTWMTGGTLAVPGREEAK